jgi:hypothetical protein
LSKETLNEDEMLVAIMQAREAGDELALSKLMSDQHTDLVSAAPASEPEVVDEPAVAGEPDPVVVDTNKSVDDPAAKEGTPPATPEKKEPVKGNGPAWIDSLPVEVRDQVLKDFHDLYGKSQYLEQYQRSNEGRVSALQRKVDTLQRELESRKSEPPTAAPSSIKLEEPQHLTKLKEEDPALYEILRAEREEILKAAGEQVSKAKAEVSTALDNKLSPFQEERALAFQREQQAIVLETIPNAREVVTSPYWKMFEEAAPEGVKRLINSDQAVDVIASLELYNSWARANFTFDEPPVNTPQAEPVVTKTPEVNHAAAKVEEERKRKLNAGAPGTKNSVSPGNLNENQEDMLETLFQQKMKHYGYTK